MYVLPFKLLTPANINCLAFTGTALSPVKTNNGSSGQSGPGEVVKAESPTSDYGDESSDALEPGELTLNDQPHTQPSRQQPIPYNPQVIHKMPPFLVYCCVISLYDRLPRLSFVFRGVT